MTKRRKITQVGAEFWGQPSVVAIHQALKGLYYYEEYLLQQATQRLGGNRRAVSLVHVVGCGTGRELLPVRGMFPDARIIASDIAPAMIEACKANLQTWGCESGIEVICCPASLLAPGDDLADLVIAFNNVLTYVTPESERRRAFGALRTLLRLGGLLIGVVHQRWGRPSKSAYFLLRQVAYTMRLTFQDPGDREGMLGEFRAPWHYFTAGEVRGLLEVSGFTPVEILSLAALGRKLGQKYRASSGYNNLIFSAEAR